MYRESFEGGLTSKSVGRAVPARRIAANIAKLPELLKLAPRTAAACAARSPIRAPFCA